MGTLNIGKVRGNMWYVGDGITGSSTTPTVFSGSGVTKAYVGDLYLHLETADDDNGHVYQCTLKGDASTAKWVYVGNILGPQPELCDDLDSTSTTKAATANAVRRLKDLIDNAGIYPVAMDFNYDETAYTTTLTIENVSTTISITDEDGNVGTYSYTASGSTEETSVTINIGEDIGYASEGAVVVHIASSVAAIKNAKLYGSNGLICDITPDMWGAVNDLNAEIKPGATITGGSGADAYSYRAGNIFKKIGGVITQLFPVTHAKAVWMDKVNGNTVHHEITTLQSDLGDTIGNLASHVLTGTKPSSQINEGEFFVDKDNAFRIANSNIGTTTDIDNTNSTVETVGEVFTELNSNKQPKTLATPITIGGASQTTVEGALGALNTAKAERGDISSISCTGATNNTGNTIAQGTYFYLNNVLCKALVNIADGATFTLNTNYETVTVGAELNSNLLGTYVDLSGYSSVQNKYVCPSDGYVEVQTDGYITVYIGDRNGNEFRIRPTYNSAINMNVFASLYVRHGMTIRRDDYLNNFTLRFLPLVQS